jgi:AraC-like DNA-binding protein
MDEVTLPRAWERLINSSDFVPVIVKTIERFHDSSWTMDPSIHDSLYEMVYMKKGSAVFEIEGQPANLGPNDIIVIKPGQHHKFIVKSESGCDFIVLHFAFENKISGEHSEIPLEDFLNFVTSKESGPYITLKVSQKNEIIVLLNRIMKERDNSEPGSDFLNYLLVLEMFVLLSRALKMEWESSMKSKSPKLRELINISIKYIHNNFERDITLGDIARFVFLSPSYFTRAFKDETGMSPISYLLKVRIERAQELLADTSLKISDIALSVGFSNQQRFNEMFKKYVHQTPLQ